MPKMTVGTLAKGSRKSIEDTLAMIAAAGLTQTKESDVLETGDITLFLKYTKNNKTLASKTTDKSLTAAKTKVDGNDAEVKRQRAVQKKREAEQSLVAEKSLASTVSKKEKSAPSATVKLKKGATATEVADDDATVKKLSNKDTVKFDKKRSLKRNVSDYGGGADLTGAGDIDFYGSPKASGVQAPKVVSQKVLSIGDRHQKFQPVTKMVCTVKFSADEAKVEVNKLAKQLMLKSGKVARELQNIGATLETIEDKVFIDRDSAILLIEELGHRYVIKESKSLADLLIPEDQSDVKVRAPVVVVMGHVDHGKTSLLDFIRQSKVTEGEAGGITQHVAAYSVITPNGEISFIDTPGHAAFSAMRQRGARCTDIVILVVAADDGAQPQTKEAIQHAKRAGVPMVVAINKIDLEQANIKKVEQDLVALEVVPESLGGDYQFVPISATTGKGVDNLLEALLLQAEILDLKAPFQGGANGVVLESRMEKGQGAIASLLVQGGCLKTGDLVLAGEVSGKIRRILGSDGTALKYASPSQPVEVTGLDGLPEAGTNFSVMKNDRAMRSVMAHHTSINQSQLALNNPVVDVEKMMAQMVSGEEEHNLNIILKADTRGSQEAIGGALNLLTKDNLKVNLLFSGTGGITESDVHLADAGTLIVGFNVRAQLAVQKIATAAKVDIRYYGIIYELLEDIEQSLKALVPPDIREEIIGIAEVREVFRSPRYGQVAGCKVVEGHVHRSNPIRILREDVVIFEGELDSLRRFKEDVTEVRNGMECGIGVKNYNDIGAGDKIEVFKDVRSTP